MKKNLEIATVALLSALLAAGCQNNASSKSSDNSAKSSQVQKSSTSTKSNGQTQQSQSKKSKSQAPKGSRLAELNHNLRATLPKMLLPENDGLGTGSDKLNIRYTKNGNVNTVYYSVGNSALSFNNAAIQKELPFAVLSQTFNLSQSQIVQNINYQEPATGLPTVGLDSTTQATKQSGAGQTYLQFNQGKWSFVIHASTVAGQDPLPTAKKVLTLSKKYKLIDPQVNSSITVNVGDNYGSLNTVITFEKNNQLYQLKAHSVETAFAMLANLK